MKSQINHVVKVCSTYAAEAKACAHHLKAGDAYDGASFRYFYIRLHEVIVLRHTRAPHEQAITSTEQRG